MPWGFARACDRHCAGLRADPCVGRVAGIGVGGRMIDHGRPHGVGLTDKVALKIVLIERGALSGDLARAFTH